MREPSDESSLSRRDFLRLVPVAAVGGTSAVLGLKSTAHALAEAAMMHGGDQRPSNIDPPPGDLFQDPELLLLDRSVAGIAEGWLTVGATTTWIAGQQAELLTYNGIFPGPTIAVKKGETLRVVASALACRHKIRYRPFEKGR